MLWVISRWRPNPLDQAASVGAYTRIPRHGWGWFEFNVSFSEWCPFPAWLGR